MDSWRQILGTGWVGNAISLLIGSIVAFLLYRASRIGGRLTYQWQALTLISGGPHELPSEVEIFFKGRGVPRLTSTLLVLWNSGKALIRGSDVVIEDPIQLTFSNESEVLRVRVLKVTRSHIKFEAVSTTGKASIVTFQFDYLDPGDGAVVEILHTDQKRYPQVSGTIRGMPGGLLDAGRVRPARSRVPILRLAGRRFFVVMLFFGFAVLLLSLSAPESWLLMTSRHSLTSDRLFLGGIGILYTVLPGLALWSTRRRFPRTLIFEDLEE